MYDFDKLFSYKTKNGEIKAPSFKNLSHEKIGSLDDLRAEISRLINPKTNPLCEQYKTKAYIGCDSQNHGHYRVFTTVVCILWQDKFDDNSGHGGVGFYVNVREPSSNFHSMREHLVKEAVYICSLAMEVVDWFNYYDVNLKPQVDINSKEEEASFKVLKEVIGYIQAHGFECDVKPDAFVATHVADRIARRG
jgi:predicted RNase H-related nuclease YkuK (DUF458 family)